MLKPVRKTSLPKMQARVGIVASEYNRKHVDGLLDSALRVLREAGAEFDVYRVPGAFEIPVAATAALGKRRPRFSAIICLGVIIRGETAHADLIGRAVTDSLMNLSVQHTVPVIHEVLLVADRAQADARCLNPQYNRGTEAAQAALAMVRLMARIRSDARPS